MKKRTLYHKVEGFTYKNGVFNAGLVKNSEHKINKIYLRINGFEFDLRIDEAYAIIGALGSALWTNYQLTEKDKAKLKWVTEKKMFK